MAIASLYIDRKTFEEAGIGVARLPLESPLEMRSLGSTVVLAGPNGSGKTRLLHLVRDLVGKQLTAAAVEAAERDIRHAQEGLSIVRQREARRVAEGLQDRPQRAQKEISHFVTQITTREKQLRVSRAMKRTSDDIPRAIEFVPRQSRLGDPRARVDNDAEERAARFKRSPGSAEAEHNAPSYARQILRAALWARDSSRADASPFESPQELAARELTKMVVDLLGPQHVIMLNSGLNVSIGGYDNYFEVLSPGQQVLFQFACLLHAQRVSVSDCLLILDEPESHLHPAALAQVIEALSKCLTSGQLWIATHSVPLIAQLTAADPDCLWYLEDGRVQRAGRAPERVLDGLMGGANGWKYLNEFTLIPALYAGFRFLSDCLKPPAVATANAADPQTNQIARLLNDQGKGVFEHGKRLRVLDFGAGKGRLLAALRLRDVAPSAWLDYFAYDCDSEYAQEREQEVALAYPGCEDERVFNDLHVMAPRIGEGTIDVVVMCNVLHEVHPDKWMTLFGEKGLVFRLLADNGFLLLMEDYGVPVGERAHPYGFLLLDEPELCKLFAITPADRGAHLYTLEAAAEPRYRNRLKAHLIGRECVGRVSPDTQCNAIFGLKERMTDLVNDFLRNGVTADSVGGRSYALTAQLLANAAVWLRAKGHR